MSGLFTPPSVTLFQTAATLVTVTGTTAETTAAQITFPVGLLQPNNVVDVVWGGRKPSGGLMLGDATLRLRVGSLAGAIIATQAMAPGARLTRGITRFTLTTTTISPAFQQDASAWGSNVNDRVNASVSVLTSPIVFLLTVELTNAADLVEPRALTFQKSSIVRLG